MTTTTNLSDLIFRLRTIAMLDSDSDEYLAHHSAEWQSADLLAAQAKQIEALQDDTEWMPIETAPKDGTVIILQKDKEVAAGLYDTNGGKYPWFVLDERDSDFTNGWQHDIAYGPTHWKPLPAARKGNV